MLNTVNSDIFKKSDEVTVLPVVSAEWNQNLFNPPYITVSGNGNKETVNTVGIYAQASDGEAHPFFTTDTLSLTYNSEGNCMSGLLGYYSDTVNQKSSYKIVCYAKTSTQYPVMVNAYASGSLTQFGSKQVEINNYGWTKIEVFIGGSSISDSISTILFSIVFNSLSNVNSEIDIYLTRPEIYENDYFNYQYNSLWPTDSPFNFFRPGESYVSTGNSKISFPSSYRKIQNNQILNGFTGDFYAPVSSVLENPSYVFMTQYTPFIKNTLPSDISQYKYFVSGVTSEQNENPSLSALYPYAISTNKIVIKFNTLVTVPTVNVYVDGSSIYNGAVPSNGVLVLYYNGSSWQTSPWLTMPQFDTNGNLSLYTTIKKISVIQSGHTVNSIIPSSSESGSTYYSEDMTRMQVIEFSPRLEIDVSSYVQDVSINKQLDSKSTVVPLSTINTDDVSLTLSGIPGTSNSGNPLPIFSNLSNSSSSVLANMLRKNIKFYLNWNLTNYNLNGNNVSTNVYIPAGIFYVDSWNENDIESINVTMYDIIRYLQTLPVPDYVSNLKSVFDIITNLLDRAGFTDYDMDSLYSVTNDPITPMDLSYYYANSQDTTVAAALTELFLAYQIGAYVDEYGIMKFLNLSSILNAGTKDSVFSIDDSLVYTQGYAVNTNQKVGKISLRYQKPKIKQTLSLQNATDPTAKNSPSFIYTTSNAQNWISSTADSVGFNYLSRTMNVNDNYYSYNINDLLDIFHTFNLNDNGYVAIENEIVSFMYKEYTISGGDSPITVSVKNDLELASAIDRYTKQSGNSLSLSDGTTPSADYNITVTPTGRITNVERGLFGTLPSQHSVISNLTDKDLLYGTLTSANSFSSTSQGFSVSGYSPTNSQNPPISVISCTPTSSNKMMVYANKKSDNNFKTYSTKFLISATSSNAAAGLFFNLNPNNASGTYFVEFIQNFTGNQAQTTETLDASGNIVTALTNVPTYQYVIALYELSGSTQNIISWADVSGLVSNIQNNFEQVLAYHNTSNSYTFLPSVDAFYQLKVVHNSSDGSNGEKVGETVDVFLNNSKITGWMVKDNSGSDLSNGWTQGSINQSTGLTQLPIIGSDNFYGTKFGAYMSNVPVTISGVTWGGTNNSSSVGHIREIYATQAVLKDKSTNYWYQTTQFLNGMIQGQNIFNLYDSYMMQTTPSMLGIKTYDVQYQTPAATSVEIYPVSYYQVYYPAKYKNEYSYVGDNTYKSSLFVDDSSLSYSTVLNTGFRGKFAIANNLGHMVWIHKDPDQSDTSSSKLILYTREIIAQSDPEIIEKVLSINNLTEVAQIDTPWIQSETAAVKMLGVIANAIDGFSKDVTLKIFGNPLIQLGDIVTVTYPLAGINSQKFVVQGAKHIFKQGLETDLTLNPVGNQSTLISY